MIVLRLRDRPTDTPRREDKTSEVNFTQKNRFFSLSLSRGFVLFVYLCSEKCVKFYG